jgi:hypothetical protein
LESSGILQDGTDDDRRGGVRKDERRYRPGAIALFIVTIRIRRMVCFRVDVRRCVRMDARGRLMVVIGVRGRMRMRVRRAGKARHDGQHRDRCANLPRHPTLSSVLVRAAVKVAGPAYNRDMRHIRRMTLAVLVAGILATAAVSAHEVTYTGTVVALKTAKYAQPGGGTREAQELEVAVVDAKTKKVANMVFTITPDTKITRAGKPVAVANVTAQKGEKVAVVIDHDDPSDDALRIRFDAAR